MRHALEGIRVLALGLIVGLAFVVPAAIAQEPTPETTQAVPEAGIKQIKLTESQVKSFISAQPDLAGIAPKLQQAGDQPDAALEAELDGIAKKHGFANFSELDDVAANISIVMSGRDVQTGQFTDPVEALKKELEEVKADSSLSEADKKQLIDELTDAIKTTPALEHQENVDLVKAHREEIEKALE
jgi:hypothetical protein